MPSSAAAPLLCYVSLMNIAEDIRTLCNPIAASHDEQEHHVTGRRSSDNAAQHSLASPRGFDVPICSPEADGLVEAARRNVPLAGRDTDAIHPARLHPTQVF